MHVSQLRKRLGGDRILTDKTGYRIVLARGELDVHHFERLVDDGRQAWALGRAEVAAAHFDESLGLWRGPALDGLGGEAFAEAEAARLEELRMQVVEDRLEAELALGNHVRVCSEAQVLVEEHPLRERVRGQLMLALYRSGRQTDALETYRHLRTTLRAEAGLEPGPAIRALQRSILNHDPDLAAPDVDSGIDAAANPFVGRKSELLDLEELLTGAARLVTLTGPEGIGKTRLAVEVARGLAGAYAPGVLFISLGEIETAEDLHTAVGRSVALAREHDVLLVLDPFDHLQDAAHVLGELLDASPHLRILLTSREPTGIDEEVEFPVEPLPAVDALVLFAERAQEGRPGFRLTPANHEVVGKICVTVGQVPAAIEQAAEQIRLFTPSALLEHLPALLPAYANGNGHVAVPALA